MTTVYTAASMSLDGYIAGPDETGFEHLFKWYSDGEVTVETTDPELTMQMSPANAEFFRMIMETTGALVVGRRLFDFTKGWGGRHPLGRTTVVLTHSVPDGWEREGENFVFVSEGIEAAVARARELADGKDVGLNGGMIASQALDAGLLEEVRVSLVPVLLGAGTPFFSQLKLAPRVLEGPADVRESSAATHLTYRVTSS
ncbi:dihydrofolate reductase family protein [Spirillospora sp. CA-294931]|uniref:dihydrofolate reductase family protein n=1 Tax=Spirillospora sp. CA-294931 TaxID=3240042 RepID=UPI003D8A79FD